MVKGIGFFLEGQFRPVFRFMEHMRGNYSINKNATIWGKDNYVL